MPIQKITETETSTSPSPDTHFLVTQPETDEAGKLVESLRRIGADDIADMLKEKFGLADTAKELASLKEELSESITQIETVVTKGENNALNRNNFLPNPTLSGENPINVKNATFEMVTIEGSLSKGISYSRNAGADAPILSINFPKSIMENGKRYRIAFMCGTDKYNWKINIRENKGVVGANLNKYLLLEQVTTADGFYRYLDFVYSDANSSVGYDYFDLQIQSNAVSATTIYEIFFGLADGDVSFSNKIKLKETDLTKINAKISELEDYIKNSKSVQDEILTKQGRVFTNFDDSAFWYIHPNLSYEYDTSDYLSGKKSMKVSCLSGKDGYMSKDIDIDLTQMIFRMHTKGVEIANITKCAILVSLVDDTFTKYAERYLTPRGTTYWKTEIINPMDWTLFGGATIEDLKSAKKIRIVLKCNANGSGSVKFSRFMMYEKTHSLPTVVFQFDDAKKNIFKNAMPVLDKYGYPATTYAITDFVGTTQPSSSGDLEFMTVSQLQILRDKGWTIGSHTKSHANLFDLTDEELNTQFMDSKEWLINNGFINGSDFVAYPRGDYNERIKNTARRYYKNAVSTDALWFSEYATDKMQIPRINLCQQNYTVNAAKALLDKIKNNNGLCVFYIHNIGDGSGYDWTVSDFETIIDYAHNLGLTFMTISDIQKMYGFDIYD